MVLTEFNLILKTLLDYEEKGDWAGSRGHYDFMVLHRATISWHSPFELDAHRAHTFDVWSLEKSTPGYDLITSDT